MNTYTFFKKDGGWYANLPQPLKTSRKRSYLDLKEGADTMLNLMSDGADEVTLVMNTEPFENAEVLELLQTCKPFLDGGYYLMREHDGREINYRMWICDVTRLAFDGLPEKIYVKRMTSD